MRRSSVGNNWARKTPWDTSPGARLRRRSHEEALALCGLFRTLAAMFFYPDERLIGDVRSGLNDALQSQKCGNLPVSLAVSLRRVRGAWQSASLEILSLEHSRLFLGSVPIALREGGYADGMRYAGQPVDLADLNGFYIAFGFGPPAEAVSPPDHIGTELEFISLLYLKIAYALDQRQQEAARITCDALGKFIKDHLGRWVDALRAALADADAAPAYRAAADLMVRAVVLEVTRLGVKPIPAHRGTASDPVGLDEFKCPLAQQAVEDLTDQPAVRP